MNERQARIEAYVAAVTSRIVTADGRETIERWLTPRCPECEHDAEDMSDSDLAAHIIIDGFVVVACEGYWVIDPNAVGIDSDSWGDWTEADDEPTDTCPTHGEQVVVAYDVTHGADPYAINRLACGHGVICFGPGDDNVIVNA